MSLQLRHAALIASVWALDACGRRSGATLADAPRMDASAEWVVREGAPGSGRTAGLLFPSIAQRDGRVAVVGQVASAAAPHLASEARTLLWVESEGEVPVPSTTSGTQHQVAFDSKGRLHLVWAESADDPVAPRTWTGNKTSVWHSIRTPQGWSAPERVLSAVVIYWSGHAPQLAIDHRDRVHIVTSVGDTGGFRTVTLRRDPDGWRQREISRHASYATLAIAGTTLVVGSAGSGADPGSSSVIVSRSGDGGDSWSAPITVVEGGQNQLHYLQLAAAGDRVYAIWSDWSEGDAGVAGVAQSLDGGRTWRPAERVPLSGSSRRVSATVDQCGDLVALFESRAVRSGRLEAVVEEVSGGGERPFASSTPQLGVSQATEMRIGRDGPRVVAHAVVLRRGEELARNALLTRPPCAGHGRR